MLRKINSLLVGFFLFLSVFSLTSCDTGNTLLLLNWGEYINMDLVSEFETKYNCEVVISLADSNDLFYSKIKSGTTVYDLVVPSDYMVEKMYKKDLLQPIDYTKLGFASFDDYLDTFVPGVKGIINDMENSSPGVKDYFVPYFWGSWGIMYNKRKAGLIDAIDKASAEGNVWKVMFEDKAIPAGTRVGMYETSRYAYAAAMFYKGLSPNDNSVAALNAATDALYNKKFTSWGTDTLKKDIAHNNLDLGFMWTGDFLDMLYTTLKTNTIDDVTFDIIIPDETIAFCDNFVLTKNARHTDLAYKFIKFFLDKDIAYRNASIVGYCTPIKDAYLEITKYKDSFKDVNELLSCTTIKTISYNTLSNKTYAVSGTYDNEKSFLLEVTAEELESIKEKYMTIIDDGEKDIDVNWLNNWAYAVNKYYPFEASSTKAYKGTPLTDLPRDYIDKINTICNNARV